MKRYLLFIISMFCVSIGAWAQDPTSGKFGASGNSDWTITGESPNQTLTLTFNNANDLPLKAVVYEWGTSWEAICSATGITKVVVNTGSGVTLSGNAGWNSPLHVLNSYYKSVPILDISDANISYEELANGKKGIRMSANDGTFKNIIVPASFSTNFEGIRITGLWGTDEIATNKYFVSGTTVIAAINTDGVTAVTNFKSDASTLKIANEVEAVDLSSALLSGQTLNLTNITTPTNGSNNIIVADGVRVIYSTDGVKNRVTSLGTPVFVEANPIIVCKASELSGRLSTLTSLGLAPTSITIQQDNETPANNLLTSLSQFNIEGLEYLSLQGATLSGVDIHDIILPSTLRALTLPKGETMDVTLKTKVIASNINYLYAPTNKPQTLLGQDVADYVWVNKSGGLAQAFDNEPYLRTAVYMKIASTVALNNVDVDFNGRGANKPTAYKYLDLSDANLTPNVAAYYTVTDDEPYRIILPDGWTGDQMAVFAANTHCGNIAAVYSYNGTTLNILEIVDAAYRQDALADARIVRSSTTAVKVVSGSHNGNIYSAFGENLRIALNNAGETSFHFEDLPNGINNKDYYPDNNITSITIATGAHVTNTLTIANKKVTSLKLSNLNNSSAVLDVTGCTALETLDLSNSTLNSVTAAGHTTLVNVILDYTNTTGDINLSGCTALTTVNADRTYLGSTSTSGVLNVSACTGLTTLNLSKVTAKSINAQNTNNLGTLNINGIVLCGMGATPDVSDGIGTVNITREDGNYDDFDIIVPVNENAFDRSRIIPSFDHFSDLYTACSLSYDAWNNAYDEWLTEKYPDYIDNTLKENQYAEYVTESYNEYVDEQYNAYVESKYNEYQAAEEAAERIPMEKGEWVNSTPEGLLSKSTWIESSPTGFQATETGWVDSNPSNLLDKTTWSEQNYVTIINKEAAEAAFAVTFVAWLSQHYSSYQTEKVEEDYNTYKTYKEGEGSYYKSKEEWLNEHYMEKTGDTYTYVTPTAEDTWNELSVQDRETPRPGDCNISAYEIETIPESYVEITAGGSVLSENVTTECKKLDPIPDANEVQILHVTGILTEADIEYIAENLTGLEVLDLSGCSYDSYQQLISKGVRKNIAIILSGKNNTEEGMYAAMHAFQNTYPSYQCVGYYTANNKLNVYATNEVVGYLAEATNPKLVSNDMDDNGEDENFTLTFLRNYSTPEGGYAGWDGGIYPEANEGLKTALGSLKAFCIDMTWLNISTLGRDFTGTNNETHYLIIPQNTKDATKTSDAVIYSNDFSDESADGNSAEDPKHYHFNDYIYAVSSYKSPVAPYATMAYFGGNSLNFDASDLNQTANLTYIRDNTLHGLNNVTDIMPDYLKNAERLIVAGRLNSNDIEGLNQLSNTQVDLTRVNNIVTSGDYPVSWSDYANSSVQYLALPDGMNNAIAATSADDFAFSGCAALKAVGAYDPSDDDDENTLPTYTVHSTAVTAPNSPSATGQENSVYVITKLCAPNDYRIPGNTVGTKKVVMSGYLTADDIEAYDATYDNVNQAGLASNNNCTIQEGDFTNAVFLNNEDLSFTGAAWQVARVTSIKLPTDSRQTLIPADCLNNFGNITEMCIPRNITTIGDRAFYGARSLHHVTTTDEDGNEIDNGDKTYTFAPTLESIGTGAFVAYKLITDVYVLATTAPRCAKDAFDVGSYVSNNTFAGVQAHPFARDKYIMNSDKGDMAILHFPSNISITEAEKYTDLTRDYSLIDETGVVDGEGRPIAWPNQSEYLRAYDQAVTGVTWDAWNKTRDAQNSIEWGTYNKSTPELNLDSSHGYDTDYMGWHQFVLCASWASHIVEPTEETVEYVSTGWNTICLPYNMTRAQLIKYLGVPASVTSGDNIVYNKVGEEQIDEDMLPDIRTMIGVTRTKELGTVKNKITIHLSKNLSAQANDEDITVGLRGATYNAKRTDQSGSTEADAKDLIYLKGGYPYFIKAYLPKSIKESMGSLSLGALTTMRITRSADAGPILGQTGYQEEVDVTNGTSVIKQETVNKPKEIKVQAVYIEGESVYFAKSDDTEDNTEAEDENDFIYSFEGQYWEQYLPLGCYYLGSGNKFYRATAKLNGNSDTWSKWTWKPYVAVVTPKVVVEEKNPIYLGEGKGYFQGYSVSYKAGDDSFADAQWARSVEMAFDEDIIEVGDDKATDIDVLNGVRIAPVTGKVYNMNGQLIGNSLEGLPKGMYIVNGKKIVVN